MGESKMTAEELLNELAQIIDLPEIEDDEITVRMLEDKTGMNNKTCRVTLERLTSAGKLTKRLARNPDGRQVMAWRKVV